MKNELSFRKILMAGILAGVVVVIAPASSEAGVIPWTYNAIFGQGPIFPNRYAAQYGPVAPYGYGAQYGPVASPYATNYAPLSYAPATYSTNYAPLSSYSTNYAPLTGYGSSYAPTTSYGLFGLRRPARWWNRRTQPYSTFYGPYGFDSASSNISYYPGSSLGVGCECDPCGSTSSDPSSTTSSGEDYSPKAEASTSSSPQTFQNQKVESGELDDDFEPVKKRQGVESPETDLGAAGTLGESSSAKEWSGTGSNKPDDADGAGSGFVGPSIGENDNGTESNNGNADSSEVVPLSPMNRQPANAEPSPGEDQNEQPPVLPDFPGIEGVEVRPLEIESTALTTVSAQRRRVTVGIGQHSYPALSRLDIKTAPVTTAGTPSVAAK